MQLCRKLMLLAFIMAYIIPCKATQPNTDRYPGGKGWQPGPKQYGYEILRDIFIQLDDSIRLEAEVAYPIDTLTGCKANGNFLCWLNSLLINVPVKRDCGTPTWLNMATLLHKSTLVVPVHQPEF
ncbi:MAG: hypothetical protein L6V92_03265 [Phocaeicola vulgatus]|nr:MAG: hypothetical protein L6V92_03265 [Phocaeicola vulgatus]